MHLRTLRKNRRTGTMQTTAKETVSPNVRRLEAASYVATITSSAIAIAALLFGSYQFYETMSAQRRSLELQVSTLQTDRNSKAAELFDKFLELNLSQYTERSPQQHQEYIYVRANRSLSYLSAIYRLTEGDKQWKHNLIWAARHDWAIREAAEKKIISCLKLDYEYVKFLHLELDSEQDLLAFCNDYGGSG